MKKIMLVLLRTLGDVVLINSLVRNVKAYYGEDSEISVFVNPEWREIIEGNPDIHEIRSEKGWHSNWFEIQKEILTGDWDEVLIPQQLTRDDNIWHQYPETREQHLFDFYLRRCRIPKEFKVDRTLRMFPTPDDKVNADTAYAWGTAGSRVIAIHTTSGNPYKDISREKWLQIIDRLYPQGYTFVQVGMPSDMAIFEKEEDWGIRPKEIFHDLRGAMTIRGIHCFVRDHAVAFMGLDSGLSYVAASTGKPTFVWYGCTIPLTSGPWGSNVKSYVSRECAVASQRGHIRCHANCGAKPNCVSHFDANLAAEMAEGILIPKQKEAQAK